MARNCQQFEQDAHLLAALHCVLRRARSPRLDLDVHTETVCPRGPVPIGAAPWRWDLRQAEFGRLPRGPVPICATAGALGIVMLECAATRGAAASDEREFPAPAAGC